MSKRSHHRNAGSFNINELADALTRNGWQPPSHPPTNPNGNTGPNMNPPFGGNPQISNNLSALGNLLGAVNGGMPNMGAPQGNPQMPPMSSMPSGGMPQMPSMPQMPQMTPMNQGAMPPMPINPMMPQSPLAMHGSPMNAANNQGAKTTAVTDLDLIKKLFQEILKQLKET